MAAILGQYNYNADTDVEFSTLETALRPVRLYTNSSDIISGFNFIDEGLGLANEQTTFALNKSYFCRAQVKMLNTEQEFDVFLIDSTQENIETNAQYVSTIKVPKLLTDNSLNYYEVRVVFTPLRANFNILLFKLKRTETDLTRIQIYDNGYQEGAAPDREIKLMRHPIFIYQELSVIKNLCGGALPAKTIMKLGIQGRPGSEFCINNERIMLNRTGIYELTHGAIVINFVSAIAPFVDNSELLNTTKQDIESSHFNLENIQEIGSRVVLSNAQSRSVNSFTIDYMF